MKNTTEAKRYFSVPYDILQGTPEDSFRCIYQRKDNLLAVRKLKIDALISGAPIDICQVSDLHFNYVDAEDFAENDPCIMSTYENRLWLRGGASLQNAIRAIEYGSHCDALAVTGDILDFYSHGALEYTEKYLWDACPDAIACLGGHDVTRCMQGKLPDEMPLEEKYKTLQSIWGHDIQYYSRVLDGRVMIIQTNNDGGAYTPEQQSRLACDLALAREKRYTVLMFQHEPFAANEPEDGATEVIRVGDPSGLQDLYYRGVGHADGGDAAKAVRSLVLDYADVVKGIFCGHWHNDIYTELRSPAGLVIPQHILTANAYRMGSVLHITVV